MLVVLLLFSLLGGLVGAGLSMYLGHGVLLICLFYMLGGMLGATAAMMTALSRQKAPAVRLKKTASKTSLPLTN